MNRIGGEIYPSNRPNKVGRVVSDIVLGRRSLVEFAQLRGIQFIRGEIAVLNEFRYDSVFLLAISTFKSMMSKRRRIECNHRDKMCLLFNIETEWKPSMGSRMW